MKPDRAATTFYLQKHSLNAIAWLVGIAAQLLPLGYWAGQLGAFR